MPKSKVEWSDPPPKTTERYDWAAIADQLKKKPHKWAIVFEQDRVSLVTAIRQDGIAALRSTKGFETRTTNNTRPAPGSDEPRRCTLYMRYVPEKDTERK